ncbi:thioredoxin [Cystobacter fuscus]|uniref:thioredoxin n=1 Tax=Cystobacter fuscus TaxID=43 RepID=UPI002B29CE6A|nr:thioredoxin [Cystobacter fuscus]
MAGDIIDVRDAEFGGQVLRADGPVLVDFTASWCAPCRALTPALEALATANKDRMKVTRLDIDENPETAQAYGIRSVPTLLLFKQGRVVGQIVGAQPRQKLEGAVEKFLQAP